MAKTTTIIHNDTPSSWNVRIIEIGAKWWYQDEEGNPTGESDIANKNVNIKSGENEALTSPRDACTYQALSIATVKAPNEDPQRFSSRETAEEEACLVRVNTHLGPQRSSLMSTSKLMEKGMDSFLEELSIDDIKSLGMASISFSDR